MTPVDPQTLMSEAKCYGCFGPTSEATLMELAYLARILLALNPMAATDPQSLMSYGKCFPCFGSASMSQIMLLSLLDQISQFLSGGVVPIISANTTFFVRTDGSDSNTGLVNSAAGAFLTIQKAVNVVSGSFLLTGVSVVIQVADGTYNEAVTLKKINGAVGAANSVTIQGNTTTPANVLVSNAGTCFAALEGVTSWTLAGMKVTSSGSFAIEARGEAKVTLNGIWIGAAVVGLRVIDSGAMTISGSFTMTVGGTYGLQPIRGGVIIFNSGLTITMSGTPVYTEFLHADTGGICLVPAGTTFAGATTATRYFGASNAVIDVAGGGANVFPGNVAGSVTTGAQYN